MDVWYYAGKALEAGSVSLELSEDERKFENCAELNVEQTTSTMTLTSRMCRKMNHHFICQLNGIRADFTINFSLLPVVTHAVDIRFSSH